MYVCTCICVQYSGGWVCGGGIKVCECGCVWYGGGVLLPAAWPSVTVLLFELSLLFAEFVDLFTD